MMVRYHALLIRKILQFQNRILCNLGIFETEVAMAMAKEPHP